MKQIPVKIDQDGKWVTTKLGLGEDRILIDAPLNSEISLKSIIDLKEKKNTLDITLKGEKPGLHIATVPKAIAVLKRVILMHCSGYRLMAYFMSPASRGGVLVQNSTWEKGAITVLQSYIWFVGQKTQICIPLGDVSNIEQTTREVNGKDTAVVKIDHVESGDVVTSFVLCPPTTLQVLYNFLKDATKDMEMTGNELDGVSAQVAMLVYSGMDSHAIENMLQISNEELEKIYDTLLELKIVEVVCVRRDVRLTTKGVRYVTDTAKSPGN
jgi:helix-turn-helix protein